MKDKPGGAFQIARQIFDSEFWTTKPSSWKIIWIYIIGKVHHKNDNGFERGEGYFNFSREAKQIGFDITTDMIKKFCQYARQNEMIDTRRSTRGMRIKVLKYNEYQTLNNFTRTNLSTREAREKHERSTPIDKNVKNVKNVKNDKDSCSVQWFEIFYQAYPKHQAKDKALSTWLKINPDSSLLEIILKAIEMQKKSDQWTKDKGQYIPMPSTWLNQKRWEDEIIEQPQTYQQTDSAGRILKEI